MFSTTPMQSLLIGLSSFIEQHWPEALFNRNDKAYEYMTATRAFELIRDRSGIYALGSLKDCFNLNLKGGSVPPEWIALGRLVWRLEFIIILPPERKKRLVFPLIDRVIRIKDAHANAVAHDNQARRLSPIADVDYFTSGINLKV
ncbi:hypothetical protein DFH29DRAFT_1084530 [Suillus ampliporus]|nr:hypothetical protein DFH29DRAFT_1084530 [Suillus ampliporus]